MNLRERNRQMSKLEYAFNELRGMRDVAARAVADLAVAGQTDTEAFARAVKLYQDISREFNDAEAARP